jgi:hypothetical protein
MPVMSTHAAAFLVCCGLAGLGGSAAAQAVPPDTTPDTTAHSAPRVPEPNVRQTVIEDDHVRVEELRVRGEVRRIVVRTQGNQPGSTYEIAPADGARDLSSGPVSARGVAGRSLWTVLSF